MAVACIDQILFYAIFFILHLHLFFSIQYFPFRLFSMPREYFQHTKWLDIVLINSPGKKMACQYDRIIFFPFMNNLTVTIATRFPCA